MSLSSLRYNAAKQRFNNQNNRIFKSIASPPSVNQKVTYSGYNPNTDKHIFAGSTGQDIEAEMGGGKGNVAQPTGGVGIIHQGFVVG